jgi:hypothetical protein
VHTSFLHNPQAILRLVPPVVLAVRVSHPLARLRVLVLDPRLPITTVSLGAVRHSHTILSGRQRPFLRLTPDLPHCVCMYKSASSWSHWAGSVPSDGGPARRSPVLARSTCLTWQHGTTLSPCTGPPGPAAHGLHTRVRSLTGGSSAALPLRRLGIFRSQRAMTIPATQPAKHRLAHRDAQPSPVPDTPAGGLLCLVGRAHQKASATTHVFYFR